MLIESKETLCSYFPAVADDIQDQIDSLFKEMQANVKLELSSKLKELLEKKNIASKLNHLDTLIGSKQNTEKIALTPQSLADSILIPAKMEELSEIQQRIHHVEERNSDLRRQLVHLREQRKSIENEVICTQKDIDGGLQAVNDVGMENMKELVENMARK